MKEKIQKLIDCIKQGRYDNEAVHGEYDSLLEEFILNYDDALKPLITELIFLEKDFWYA